MNDERAETLWLLKQVRQIVASVAPSLTFTDKTSCYLDQLDQAIARMEHRE
ncbi:MAG: hypothetical protein ABL970_08940 [Nitrospira sp.]